MQTLPHSLMLTFEARARARPSGDNTHPVRSSPRARVRAAVGESPHQTTSHPQAGLGLRLEGQCKSGGAPTAHGT